jgi:NTP pyrophosphatase (non-canonical NTP hydrolase)
MKLRDYQLLADKYACYDDPEYPFFALAEEVGEFLGKIAKFKRGDDTFPDQATYLEALQKELGDVLWQWQACCKELGLDVEMTAQANLDKLESRFQRYKLKGEGDER